MSSDDLVKSETNCNDVFLKIKKNYIKVFKLQTPWTFTKIQNLSVLLEKFGGTSQKL